MPSHAVSLVPSQAASITTIVLHVGLNDTSRQESECTKNDYKLLFNILKNTGKSVFISGPTPSFGTELRALATFSICTPDSSPHATWILLTILNFLGSYCMLQKRWYSSKPPSRVPAQLTCSSSVLLLCSHLQLLLTHPSC